MRYVGSGACCAPLGPRQENKKMLQKSAMFSKNTRDRRQKNPVGSKRDVKALKVHLLQEKGMQKNSPDRRRGRARNKLALKTQKRTASFGQQAPEPLPKEKKETKRSPINAEVISCSARGVGSNAGC